VGTTRIGLLLGVAALSVTVTAQSEKPQDQQPPRFRVEANFVRVDAYPMKDGKPLGGLTAADFEVFEDNVPQKIDTFEHVIVRSAGNDERIDPGSQRAALQAVANPRNRVFVIFLDIPHVQVASAHDINEPLIRLVNRLLGPDDLVGVMTPEMDATQVVFARKTQVIEDSLRKNWPWGTRFEYRRDKQEEAYEGCYPPLTTEKPPTSELAAKLIARKRERATLEALQDLVRYMRTIREERKAILTVSEGWVLFGEDRSLMTLRRDPKTGVQEPIPGIDPISVGPTGKLTTKDPRSMGEGALSKTECDTDRFRLASMDNRQFFRDIMEDANRANASFYPIDPRGLPAFDNPIGPEEPPPPFIDQQLLKRRIENLQVLAENTDGMAVVNSNDLDRGLKRISDDLTSYYLLGYYSTNTKLDGRFRSLKVRVKQSGVSVRARHGYRAATTEEVAAARRAADAPMPDATRAVKAAISRLDGYRPEARFRINAVTAAGEKGAIWVAGELQSPGGRPDEFAEGATADIEATRGSSSTTAQVKLKPGERSFQTMLQAPSSGAGELSVRVRLRPVEGTASALQDAVQLPPDTSAAPLYFRRGATTGNKLLPAADLRFSRTERVRLEIPVAADAKSGAGRLLDRAGQPLEVPVTVSERTDETTGQHWVAADVNLGPLAPGDYGIEVGFGKERVVTAIRVTR
jgi:VWFA-related protein